MDKLFSFLGKIGSFFSGKINYAQCKKDLLTAKLDVIKLEMRIRALEESHTKSMAALRIESSTMRESPAKSSKKNKSRKILG